MLTSKNKSDFNWRPEHEQIRLKVIAILTEAPDLTIFDPQHSIELHTDASSIGYGPILLHNIDNKPHMVKYFSKYTSPSFI